MAEPGNRPALDLGDRRSIHIIGIGGAGMSAIATVLVGMGHTVTGSDLKESAGLERLRSLGIDVRIGHDADHVGEVDAVTISTAIPDRNPELVAATERGLPVYRRAEILAALTAQRRTVAVGGTHGKTTTASMLALVLVEAGVRPSFVIGGDVNEIGSGAVWDEGDWFVVEADESDGTFVELAAEAVVVTSVEPDHLEHYGGFDSLVAAFERFLADAPGPKVVCADDPLAADLGRAAGASTYGMAADARYRMVDVELERASTTFPLLEDGRRLGVVDLPVPGAHNARNAAAAIVAGLQLGASIEAGRRALGRFAGVARRFEFRGERDGVTFVDDYAHLPTEIRSVLDAAGAGGWDRVVCVFQPHRYSRIGALWREFGPVFADADLVAVTDIYAAGEPPRPGVSGKLIVDAVLDAQPWKRVAYLPRRSDLVPYLSAELRGGDLCLTLGAGDLTVVPDDVQTALAAAGGEA